MCSDGKEHAVGQDIRQNGKEGGQEGRGGIGRPLGCRGKHAMTKLNPSNIVVRETVVSERGRPIVVELHPAHLVLR